MPSVCLPGFQSCHILVVCVLVRKDESNAVVDENDSYVVEKRRQHVDSGQSGSNISDVVDFLLRDYRIPGPRNVCRVFELCCLVVGVSIKSRPSVMIDLSGSAMDPRDFRSCVELVQSHVLSSGYTQQSFFTEPTLDAVRAAVCDAGISFYAPGFSLWKNFCGSWYD